MRNDTVCKNPIRPYLKLIVLTLNNYHHGLNKSGPLSTIV